MNGVWVPGEGWPSAGGLALRDCSSGTKGVSESLGSLLRPVWGGQRSHMFYKSC